MHNSHKPAGHYQFHKWSHLSHFLRSDNTIVFLPRNRRSYSEGWHTIKIMIWAAQWRCDIDWNINIEINSLFRNGKQRMLFLLSVMSTHAEDWEVEERDPLDKCNQWSKGGGKKGECRCGRITEGERSGGEAFSEQLLKSPKEPMVLWWHPEPFWGGRAQGCHTSSWKCFYTKGGKSSPRRATPYFNCMGEAANNLEGRIIVQNNLWQTGEMRWESKIESWPVRTNAKFYSQAGAISCLSSHYLDSNCVERKVWL